jgi:cytochrome c biogenesis protein CcdA
LLELVGLVAAVGLADSLNPSTIGPALYLATGSTPVRSVAEFTVGVFVVYLAGGLLIALGPGELLLSTVSRPSATTKHILELIAGVVLVAAAGGLWMKRRELAAKPRPGRRPSRRSALLLGGGIMAIELATALPYFAVIAAVLGSGASVVGRIELLSLFCAAFCVPLVAIAVALAIAGERAEAPLGRAGDLLDAHWPAVLAGLLLAAGIAALTLGSVGLARS